LKKRWIAWFALALLLATAVWSVAVEPRWVVRRDLAYDMPGWAGPPGLKVAVAGDWHFTKRGWWRVMTVERARALVEEINAARPDIILLPGDFISDRDYRPTEAATPEDEIAGVLGQLRAPLGVHAVLGNHDYWHGPRRFKSALRRGGIEVLENEAKPIPGTDLWLAGIGDHSTGHSHVQAALSLLPAGAQALVFMHDPASLRELPRVPGLAIAAHTHGGQVFVPGIGALIVPSDAPRSWAHGWVSHNGNTAYVTSGLGVSILPVRFNMRPEWVLFTLNAAPAAPAAPTPPAATIAP